MDVLKRIRLDRPGADPKTPVFIQSFSVESLKKMRLSMKVTLPLLFLVAERDRDVWLTRDRMAEIRTFADGIGPDKRIVSGKPEIVAWAHEAGLSVTPYTFRPAGQPAGRTVRDEMHEFLFTFGVDALFTDNSGSVPATVAAVGRPAPERGARQRGASEARWRWRQMFGLLAPAPAAPACRPTGSTPSTGGSAGRSSSASSSATRPTTWCATRWPWPSRTCSRRTRSTRRRCWGRR